VQKISGQIAMNNDCLNDSTGFYPLNIGSWDKPIINPNSWG
jgi:hypothetical protein